MKIAFFCGSTLPFQAATLEQRPLGGIETAVIRLAEALTTRKHRVTVLTTEALPQLSEPLYLPLRAVGDLGPVDAFIAVRDWQGVLLEVKTALRYFWTGDAYDQPLSFGLGDPRIARRIDRFLAVSEWHRKSMCASSGFPPERSAILRNGIKLALFDGTEERRPKRLVYSSTPYRGLAFLPSIFRRIKERHPDAELRVFSGFDVYAAPSLSPPPAALAEFEATCRELTTIPGAIVRGNVRQDELAREFMRAAVLAYPNTFEETSCITAMEAQAGGCAVVTSARAALPETVGDAGILIEGQPGTPAYDDRFVQAVDSLLSDPALWQRYSARAKERANSFDWAVVAEEFEGFLRAQHLPPKL